MPRRFQRRRGYLLFGVGAIGLLLAVRIAGERLFPSLWRAESSAVSPLARRTAFVAGPINVVRVIAGDTLLIEQKVADPNNVSKTLRIEDELRLLGISTPEDGPWREAAAEYVCSACAGEVRIELDKRRVNRFGQFLAYVYVDDRLLNAELVREGLARVDPYPGDNMTIARTCERAEKEAQRAGRGIWLEKVKTDEATNGD